MGCENEIIKWGKAHGGYVVCRELPNISGVRMSLSRMVKRDAANRLAQGIYLLSGYPEDEFYTLSLIYEKGVFSRHTALYINGISNRQLEYIEANFPRNYNTMQITNIKCHRVSDEIYWLGQTIVATPLGHNVKAYNVERCICDLFYYDDFDIEEKSFVVKAADKTKLDYDKLFAYAKQMKVLPQVKSVFEVL